MDQQINLKVPKLQRQQYQMNIMEGGVQMEAEAADLACSSDKNKDSKGIQSNLIKNMLLIQPTSNNNHPERLQLSKTQSGCANKLCKSYSLLNKDQQLEISPETLCSRCKQQFEKDSFCIYCKQIYFDETDDGKEWIMCEQCSRWVHSQCADFNTKENPNALFQCIKCKKVQSLPNGRRNIPRTGYAKLEKKKNFQFLNSIGFQWQLATHQVTEDMENIRKYLG